jgi:hypothetical protein
MGAGNRAVSDVGFRAEIGFPPPAGKKIVYIKRRRKEDAGKTRFPPPFQPLTRPKT